jgi:hypothetical protein
MTVRSEQDIRYEQKRAQQCLAVAPDDKEANYDRGVFDALAWVLKELNEIPYAQKK